MDFAIYTISLKGFFYKYYEIHQDDILVYRVQKPSFFNFNEMYFTDPGGNEVLNITRHNALFQIGYKFVVSNKGKPIATIEKNSMDNFYESSSIYGNHTIQGDFFNSEYTVFDKGGEIAKISRKRFRSNKKYGIAIIKGNNELYILAMIIAISIVNSRGKKKG